MSPNLRWQSVGRERCDQPLAEAADRPGTEHRARPTMMTLNGSSAALPSQPHAATHAALAGPDGNRGLIGLVDVGKRREQAEILSAVRREQDYDVPVREWA